METWPQGSRPPQGQRCVPGGRPDVVPECDGQKRRISSVHFRDKEEMATPSSVLAWRIPGTAGPGGLLSMGSHSQTRLKQLSSSSSGKTARLNTSFPFNRSSAFQRLQPSRA